MMAVHDAPKRYHRISPVRRWRITVAVVWAWTIAMVAIAIILAVSISSDAVGQPRTVAARPEQKRIELDIRTAPETAKPAASDPVDQISGTWIRTDIPLGVLDQQLLHDAAAEFGIDYTLALAVVQRETNYRNVMGDNGNSYGYMQIQPRWWGELIDRIGASDLLDPADNFRAGCAILRDLIDRSGSEYDALSCYNTGKAGHSSYADAVMAIREELIRCE